MEKEWLEMILREAKFNIVLAAKISGVSRAGLYNKLKTYRLRDWYANEKFLLRKPNFKGTLDDL
jgi:DNA-binding NtrC family response regulator